ncbi:UL16-binding protein 2-like [Dipodomys merriami]|uniref:UL16-binding protein 2-like n=1 Tax=Dipodomys merriami TaxID=94247 RepID=UPI003855F4AA
MARAGHSASAPRDSWILRLLCGLFCWNVADAHSLSYNITVVSNQWWFEAYGQVDQHTFLYYNSSNHTCSPEGLFGRKVIETEAWQKQPDILKDVGDILRPLLAQIKFESGATTGDPCTLLGKMSCQPEGNGKISGFWQLVYNGQILLHFDSNTQQWTEVHPGSSWIKKILEEDRSVTDVFYKTLVGDCASWLKQFWGPWEEMQPTAQPAPNKCTRITLSHYVVLFLALSTLFVNQEQWEREGLYKDMAY